MNLMTLVSTVAESTGLPPKQVRSVLDSAFQAITGSLLRGDSVRTPFGTFSVKARAAKTGWNIHTGSPVKIPATKVVKFKPAAALKDAVSRGRKTLAKRSTAAATKTPARKKAAPARKASAPKTVPKAAAAAKTALKKATAAQAVPIKKSASRRKAG
jgi:DNA-binding protein HU-beta